MLKIIFSFLLLLVCPSLQLPSWVDSGVIYGIAPLFMNNNSSGTLKMIQNRLPELVDLGVKMIWIQPIFPNQRGGEAYDVTDYFSIWKILGDFQDLSDLITDAHSLGLKVLLDLVLDHTSVAHPFALDVQKYGDKSSHRSFYMDHECPGFGDMQHTETVGNGSFVYFFDWPYLLNVNYSGDGGPYMSSVMAYWISKFDVDGYRCDAMWGVLMRNLDGGKQLTTAARSARKDPVLLLAESGPTPLVKEAGFDAAYDWSEEIGHWGWDSVLGLVDWSNLTVDAIRQVVAYTAKQNLPIVRFIENNDQVRFLPTHTIQQTRSAAILMFSLPGIPMMYYGQEVGAMEQFPSYDTNRTIKSYDHDGWWNFYHSLITTRANYNALKSGEYSELNSSEGAVYAFVRFSFSNCPTITVFNTKNESVSTQLTIDTLRAPLWHDVVSSARAGSCGPTWLCISLAPYQSALLVPSTTCSP